MAEPSRSGASRSGAGDLPSGPPIRGLPAAAPGGPGADSDHLEAGRRPGDAAGAARRRRLVRAVALAVTPALIVAALMTALRDDGDADTELADPTTTETTTTTSEDPSSPPTTEPPPTPDPTIQPPPPRDPPSEWDPNIAELARFVERERQLTFEHPVHVELLSEQEYLARTGGDTGSMGFYDGQGIVVRGTELTPVLEGTIVHELTHAVDDQHFGLGNLQGGARSPEELSVIGHLIEGDAVRLEWAYDAMLIANGTDPADVFDQVHAAIGAPGVPIPVPPPASTPSTTAPDQGGGPGGTDDQGGGREGGGSDEQGGGRGTGNEGDSEENDDEPGGRTTTTVDARGRGTSIFQVPTSPDEAADPALPYGASYPPLSGAFDISPYFIGKQMIDVLVARGGNAAVDAAFRDPPRTTEQVLDPRAYLADEGPREVAPSAEAVPKSDFQDQASLGALNLYLVLAAGIDPVAALDAVTGWGGESAQAYTDAHGHHCVRLAVVGDTAEDTEEIGEAFEAWVESGFAEHASTERRGDGAQMLTACEFGASSPTTDPFDALVLAEVRGAEVWAAMRDARMDAGDAFAYADCVVHAVPPATLLSPPAGELRPDVRDALEEAAASC
ncbi:MAG TPA: hypothetical protein VIL48_17010 [Acidimicrobiales bacterium]